MGRQQHGDTVLTIDLEQKVAYAVFGDHVQADRWLVQVQDFGIVQERRRQVAPHALAQRQLTHGRAEKWI